jgi:hypothetical protein
VKTETHDADRAEMIAGLRAMADWLEAHPGVAVDRFSPVTMNLFAETEDEARAVRAAAPGGWEKDAKGDYLTYARQFSGEGYRCVVEYQVHVNKRSTCERVQVGTRHVEAVEAHDEPVYEWRCAPPASPESPLLESIRSGEPLPVVDDDMDGDVPDVKVWSRKISTGVVTYRWIAPSGLAAYEAEIGADPDRELVGHGEPTPDLAVAADRAAHAAATMPIPAGSLCAEEGCGHPESEHYPVNKSSQERDGSQVAR